MEEKQNDLLPSAETTEGECIDWDTDEMTESGITRREILQRVRAMTLMDDDFMSKVFEDIPCAEHLLRTILKRDDLQVLEVHPQHDLRNLEGRSVRLDIYAIDETGKRYDIEVQRDNRGANIKRARYNSCLIDASITEPGEDYEALSENYVIFIVENDIFKKKLPIYHIERTILETGEPVNDGAHIIYVNTSCVTDTPLGLLVQDMKNPDPYTLHSEVLAERSKYVKGYMKGGPNMCQAVQELCEMARARENEKNKALIEAAEEKAEKATAKLTQAVLRLWEKGGFDISDIALTVDLTIEEVKSILSGNNIAFQP